MTDPYRDFLIHEKSLEEKVESLPQCDRCNNPIYADYVWVIDGEVLCDECAKALYRQYADNFIKEDT